MKFDVIYNVPTWAAFYLVCGDAQSSRLSMEDRKEVEGFLLILKKQGIVRFIEPINCSEQVFNEHPVFGEPCKTQDWIVEVAR